MILTEKLDEAVAKQDETTNESGHIRGTAYYGNPVSDKCDAKMGSSEVFIRYLTTIIVLSLDNFVFIRTCLVIQYFSNVKSGDPAEDISDCDRKQYHKLI